MLDFQELLLSIVKNLDKDSAERKLIDKALEEQDYIYDERGFFKTIHTNPLYAAFDDPTIFKIGDIICNKNSGITAKVTTYLDEAYGLSNGCRVPAKDKSNWILIKNINSK
jgi:hypothetical protein